MEFIAAILVIVVLCIILGVSTGVMIAAALALVGLIIVFCCRIFHGFTCKTAAFRKS